MLSSGGPNGSRPRAAVPRPKSRGAGAGAGGLGGSGGGGGFSPGYAGSPPLAALPAPGRGGEAAYVDPKSDARGVPHSLAQSLKATVLSEIGFINEQWAQICRRLDESEGRLCDLEQQVVVAAAAALASRTRLREAERRAVVAEERSRALTLLPAPAADPRPVVSASVHRALVLAAPRIAAFEAHCVLAAWRTEVVAVRRVRDVSSRLADVAETLTAVHAAVPAKRATVRDAAAGALRCVRRRTLEFALDFLWVLRTCVAAWCWFSQEASLQDHVQEVGRHALSVVWTARDCVKAWGSRHLDLRKRSNGRDAAVEQLGTKMLVAYQALTLRRVLTAWARELKAEAGRQHLEEIRQATAAELAPLRGRRRHPGDATAERMAELCASRTEAEQKHAVLAAWRAATPAKRSGKSTMEVARAAIRAGGGLPPPQRGKEAELRATRARAAKEVEALRRGHAEELTRVRAEDRAALQDVAERLVAFLVVSRDVTLLRRCVDVWSGQGVRRGDGGGGGAAAVAAAPDGGGGGGWRDDAAERLAVAEKVQLELEQREMLRAERVAAKHRILAQLFRERCDKDLLRRCNACWALEGRRGARRRWQEQAETLAQQVRIRAAADFEGQRRQYYEMAYTLAEKVIVSAAVAQQEAFVKKVIAVWASCCGKGRLHKQVGTLVAKREAQADRLAAWVLQAERVRGLGEVVAAWRICARASKASELNQQAAAKMKGTFQSARERIVEKLAAAENALLLQRLVLNWVQWRQTERAERQLVEVSTAQAADTERALAVARELEERAAAAKLELERELEEAKRTNAERGDLTAQRMADKFQRERLTEMQRELFLVWAQDVKAERGKRAMEERLATEKLQLQERLAVEKLQLEQRLAAEKRELQAQLEAQVAAERSQLEDKARAKVAAELEELRRSERERGDATAERMATQFRALHLAALQERCFGAWVQALHLGRQRRAAAADLEKLRAADRERGDATAERMAEQFRAAVHLELQQRCLTAWVQDLREERARKSREGKEKELEAMQIAAREKGDKVAERMADKFVAARQAELLLRCWGSWSPFVLERAAAKREVLRNDKHLAELEQLRGQLRERGDATAERMAESFRKAWQEALLQACVSSWAKDVQQELGRRRNAAELEKLRNIEREKGDATAERMATQFRAGLEADLLQRCTTAWSREVQSERARRDRERKERDMLAMQAANRELGDKTAERMAARFRAAREAELVQRCVTAWARQQAADREATLRDEHLAEMERLRASEREKGDITAQRMADRFRAVHLAEIQLECFHAMAGHVRDVKARRQADAELEVLRSQARERGDATAERMASQFCAVRDKESLLACVVAWEAEVKAETARRERERWEHEMRLAQGETEAERRQHRRELQELRRRERGSGPKGGGEEAAPAEEDGDYLELAEADTLNSDGASAADELEWPAEVGGRGGGFGMALEGINLRLRVALDASQLEAARLQTETAELRLELLAAGRRAEAAERRAGLVVARAAGILGSSVARRRRERVFIVWARRAAKPSTAPRRTSGGGAGTEGIVPAREEVSRREGEAAQEAPADGAEVDALSRSGGLFVAVDGGPFRAVEFAWPPQQGDPGEDPLAASGTL